MKNIIFGTLRDFWTDSVWSKVISGIILLIYGYLMAINNSTEYRVVSTIVLLVGGLVIAILWRLLFGQSNVLLDLSRSKDHDVEKETPKAWDQTTKKVFGDEGSGDHSFNKGILKITRDNTAGRYLLRFRSYTINRKRSKFIPNSDRTKQPMRLFITFDAKVAYGAHTFRVMCKMYHGKDWVPDADSLSFRITHNEYQPYSREIKIPVGEDFRIQVDDIENENPNSSIYIKDFKVTTS